VIRWQDLDPARIERAVQALIRRLHPFAQSIDGTGGDDGRDLIWRSPEGLVIFEIKSYTGRLSNSAKPKIATSLRKAAAHRPVRWCLILPLNQSPAELTWFDELRGRYPECELEWRGRDWLDSQFAKHEDLRRFVEGSDYALLERAREMEKEQAVLSGGIPDLLDRYRILNDRALDLSPYWQTDVATGQDGLQVTVREKYPGSASDDPIIFHSLFAFPAGDPAAKQAEEDLRLVLDFGGDVTVPGEYIERFDIQAAEETRRLWEPLDPAGSGSLRITSVEDNTCLPLVCHLELLDAESRVKRELAVSLTRRVRGQRGATLTGADSACAIKLRVQLGLDENDEPTRSGSPTSGAPLSGPILGRICSPPPEVLRHSDSPNNAASWPPHWHAFTNKRLPATAREGQHHQPRE
jgi:hypothetical protein